MLALMSIYALLLGGLQRRQEGRGREGRHAEAVIRQLALGARATARVSTHTAPMIVPTTIPVTTLQCAATGIRAGWRVLLPCSSSHAGPQAVAMPMPKLRHVTGAEPEELIPTRCVQVRLLALAGAVVLASRGTALLSRHAAAFVYVLAYGTWTGANLWTTFIGGARFRALGVQCR